jgi:hypothetical protein
MTAFLWVVEHVGGNKYPTVAGFGLIERRLERQGTGLWDRALAGRAPTGALFGFIFGPVGADVQDTGPQAVG